MASFVRCRNVGQSCSFACHGREAVASDVTPYIRLFSGAPTFILSGVLPCPLSVIGHGFLFLPTLRSIFLCAPEGSCLCDLPSVRLSLLFRHFILISNLHFDDASGSTSTQSTLQTAVAAVLSRFVRTAMTVDNTSQQRNAN
jgi:hypothetical protein